MSTTTILLLELCGSSVLVWQFWTAFYSVRYLSQTLYLQQKQYNCQQNDNIWNVFVNRI